MHSPTDLISLIDAAHEAGVVPSTLYRWASAGKITLFKRGRRTFVRRADITRVLAPHAVRSARR